MSDAQRPLPPKKDVALALLEREPSVFIHLDPRRPGVSVPKWFTGQPQLILQVGLNMSIPIPDLRVDDEGISCTLSFNRSPFWCRIPWDAVWALVNEQQRGMVWPDDIPSELVTQRQRGPAPPQRQAKRPRPRLAAVESVPEGGEPEASEAERPAARLRVADAPPPSESGEDGGEANAGAAEASPSTEAAAAATASDEAASARPEGAADGEDPGEASPAGAATRGGKPKRELPPYLRVIK